MHTSSYCKLKACLEGGCSCCRGFCGLSTYASFGRVPPTGSLTSGKKCKIPLQVSAVSLSTCRHLSSHGMGLAYTGCEGIATGTLVCCSGAYKPLLGSCNCAR